jgi:delta-aminolevulinic acid dehydratase/porphobilinogen synthase
MVMVKPAGPYLDVISRCRHRRRAGGRLSGVRGVLDDRGAAANDWIDGEGS